MPNYALNMPRLTVTVTREIAEWVTQVSEERGCSISEIVREAVTLLQEVSRQGTAAAEQQQLEG